MLTYILRRFAIALVAIFVLATITFFLLRVVPGDPFAGPRITTEIRARLHAHYGLDRPLFEQYLIYMANLAQGDFGYSLSQRGRRVNDIIATAFPVSLDLGLRAMFLAIVFGLWFGVVSALNRGKRFDYLTIVLVLIGISVPSFVVGGILQYVFAVQWPILPVARYETFASTIMPAFALSLATMATIARYMRASMLEVVTADYIRTAVAKGLRRREVVWRHQIRNAIFPILSILGPVIASVLTGSFVIESIFAVPGLGRYFIIAMQNLDYTLVMGLTVFFGAFLIAVNFLVDVAYGFVDPLVRVR
jgi:oligopeptide transport system permease protein